MDIGDITLLRNELNITNILQSYKLSFILISAFKSGLFDRIGKTGLDKSDVNSAIDIACIKVLCSFGIVKSMQSKFVLEHSVAECLLSSGRHSLKNFALLQGYHANRYCSELINDHDEIDYKTWQSALLENASYENKFEIVKNLISDYPINSLLDVGGGLGGFSKYLVESGVVDKSIVVEKGPVIGLAKDFCFDISRISVVDYDEFVNFKDVFDCVLLSNFIHGRTERFLEDLLLELSKKCKYLLVVNPFLSDEDSSGVEGALLNFTMVLGCGIGSYSKATLISLAEKCNWELVHFEDEDNAVMFSSTR